MVIIKSQAHSENNENKGRIIIMFQTFLRTLAYANVIEEGKIERS